MKRSDVVATRSISVNTCAGLMYGAKGISSSIVSKAVGAAVLLTAAGTNAADAVISRENNAPNRAGTTNRPNVLFISVDDLNDWVGCLGNTQVKTPNIDRLAKRAVLFTAANCAAPLCNASRVALWTGYRPSSSGIYENSNYQRDSALLKNAPVMQEYFKAHGYTTLGSGKIFHTRNPSNLWVNPQAWDDYVPQMGGHHRTGSRSHGFGETELVRMFDWGPNNTGDGSIEETLDFRNAEWAAEKLKQPHPKPFFLCYGSIRPHLPLYVPPSFFAQYPPDRIALPPYLDTDLEDVPPLGKEMAQLAPFTDKREQMTRDFHSELVAKGKWKEVVQAYLASITFADACVGRVMDEMEKSPDAGNTIIILFGDNGWHLGEKNHWQKCTLWERSAHIPLMIYAPGLTPSSGGVCTRPVSLVDLYPTLVELCGLPPREGLDGHSLVPLLKSPSAAWAYPAITTYQRGNHAVRSEQWRYIRYHDGTEELYNMMKDPNEWHNLARDPEYQTVLAEHRMWLPKTDAEAVVRSNESDERFNPGGTKRKSKTEPSE